MPCGEDALAQLVLQEAGAARDAGAVDRPRQVAEQTAGDAGIVDHGEFRGFRSRRVEPCDGTLAGAVADLRRVVQVGQMHRAVQVVVALHRRSRAGQRGGGDRVTGAHRPPGEAGGGDEERLGAAEARIAALGVGDAVHRQGGVLGGGGAGDQRLGGGFGGVFQVQGDVPRRRGGVGQAGVGVLRHDAGHGDRTLRQFGEPGGIDGGGRDDGGLLAQEHAQAEVAAFGALDVLCLAEAAGDGQRGAGDQHRVGGIGAGGTRAGEQVGEEVEGIGHDDLSAGRGACCYASLTTCESGSSFRSTV